MSEEVKEEVVEDLDSLEQAQRVYLSEIMRQLTESERFQRFFKVNYEVQTHFDKVSETFDIRLIERPPELAAEHLRKLAMEHAEEHMPSVVIPTGAEVAALTKNKGKK